MGSNIQLPALAVQPPQASDPIGAYGKMLSLRSLLQGQQMQQQQIQAGQQENQMRGLQLQDQQTLRESAKGLDWTQPDAFEKLITNAQQQGVSPQTLSQLSLQRAQYQEQLAKTDAATLAAEKDRNSQFQGHIDALKGITDPAQRAQGAQVQGTQILQGGLAKTPQLTQLAQTLAQGKYVPTDDDLAMFENGLTDHNTQIDQRLKQAETQKNATDALLNQNKLDVINSWKQNPQQVLSQVDAIVPPTGTNAALNARTKSQVQFAMGNGDVDGAKAAIKQAAEQVGAVEKDVQESTNPAIQNAKVALAQRTKLAEQIITQGDPAAAGKLLADGSLTLSELKSRGTTPQFIVQATNAAQQANPGFNPQKAEADLAVAKSPNNVAFFGSAKSLTDKGGTLDQLNDAAKDIPGGRIPVFNSIADAAKAATGSGPVAKYATILLGVSDDYSKVMGGGQGSDTSRNQALTLAPTSASPAARAAAIEGIRGSVSSQINSRIGNNSVLQKMYGGGTSQQTAPAQPTAQTHSFSVSAWKRANPTGDVDAASAAATAQGFQVGP